MNVFERILTQEQIDKDLRKERHRRNMSSVKSECTLLSAVALGIAAVIFLLAH